MIDNYYGQQPVPGVTKFRRYHPNGQGVEYAVCQSIVERRGNNGEQIGWNALVQSERGSDTITNFGRPTSIYDWHPVHWHADTTRGLLIPVPYEPGTTRSATEDFVSAQVGSLDLTLRSEFGGALTTQVERLTALETKLTELAEQVALLRSQVADSNASPVEPVAESTETPVPRRGRPPAAR